MILNNVKKAGTDELINILINDGKIADVSATAFNAANNNLQLTFDNAIIFPGLINSHDHLDFNLFPQLGNRTYSNYTEWGKYIHRNYREEIAAVLKIPPMLRAQWGIYKNLVCGVTTVINHGEKLATANDLITVFEETNCIHSVGFEKRWKLKLNNPLKNDLPVNIHAGEGDDWSSYNEINRLIRWNLFKKKLVAVHAVAMTEEQATEFEAIVWCPQSNYFLLKKTAPVDVLKKQTTMLFGTDSTLTSGWDIWDHLKSARKTRLLDDETLYKSLTQNAARVWKLNCGEIATGKDADIVIAKIKPKTRSFDTFFATEPAEILLVIHRGHIRLFDETLMAQLQTTDLSKFSKIYVNGVGKYVEGNLPGLIENIREYQPEANFQVQLQDMEVAMQTN